MTDPPVTQPQDIAHRFVQAWNDRDPDALAELFEEDAEFVNVTGLWWHDRAAIREAHAYGLTRIFSESTLQLSDVRVKSLSDTVAVVHARMRLTGQTPPEGVAKVRPRRTIFSFVVRLGPAGWRCASAQNTDVVPGAETHAVDASGKMHAVTYRARPASTRPQ